MSNQWGNREQPSIPEPARLGIEHVWLAGAVVAFTTAVIALIVEDQTSVEIFRGTYSVLAGMFVSGCIAWKVGHAERRMRREYNHDRQALAAHLAQMTANQQAVMSALNAINRQLAAQRRADLPGKHTPNRWPREDLAAAVGSQIQHPPTPLVDAETQAALRRLQMRVLRRDEPGQG